MTYEEYLCHYGIQGMKWGIRRYQNPDGTLTEAGKKRLKKSLSKEQANTGFKIKASEYRTKESKNRLKAERRFGGDFKKAKKNRKAAKYGYKAAKLEEKIAKNEIYIDFTKQHISSISPSMISKGEAFVAKNIGSGRKYDKLDAKGKLTNEKYEKLKAKNREKNEKK